MKRDKISGIELCPVGSKCCTITKAMPVSGDMLRKNCSKASNLPAKAPMPIIRKNRPSDKTVLSTGVLAVLPLGCLSLLLIADNPGRIFLSRDDVIYTDPKSWIHRTAGRLLSQP